MIMRNLSSRKLLCLALMFLIVIGCQRGTCLKDIDLIQTQLGCESQLKSNLLEVNSDYAIEITRDANQTVTKVFIAPKSHFGIAAEHQPVFLEQDDYEKLIEIIDKTYGLGTLRSSLSGSIVSNSKVWKTFQYDRGFIYRGDIFSIEEKPNETNKIWTAEIFFFFEKEVFVEKIFRHTESGLNATEILVGDHWYFVEPSDDLEVGTMQKLSIAGPYKTAGYDIDFEQIQSYLNVKSGTQ